MTWKLSWVFFRTRGDVLWEPAAVTGHPPHRLRAVPAAGEAGRLRPRLAPELQHQGLWRALQPRLTGGGCVLQLPARVRLRRAKDVPVMKQRCMCNIICWGYWLL